MLKMLSILKLVGGSISFIWLPFTFLFLLLDGFVYTLVGLSYKVFQLTTQLNLSTIEAWASPLINRVKAVIAVFILFIIGYNLVLYLINPDKAMDKTSGGVSMIKNIVIASILLISYTFVFQALNEFTFVMVGTPSTYKYKALGDIFDNLQGGQDDGLISRLIFGSKSEENEIDFGRRLAVNTLSLFLHGDEKAGLYDPIAGYDKSVVGQVFDTAINAEDFSMIWALPNNVASEVAKSVYYFPILSTAVGAYIVYSLVMISIELAKRAFKLIILQILAPVAIVSIMKDGFNAKLWKNFVSVYIKTYLDAFIRIGAAYFSFAIIGVVFSRFSELFDANEASGFTGMLVVCVVIVGALSLGKELPKLIDSVLGSKLAENNKTGLASFIGGMAGFASGKLIGGASGAATRWKNSRNAGLSTGRSLFNAAAGAVGGSITGGFSGAVEGFKGKSIVDKVKGISSKSSESGSIGVRGYVQGISDDAGIGKGGALKAKIEALDKIKEERDAYLKLQGKKSFVGGTIKTRINANSSNPDGLIASGPVEFDYSKEKSAAIEDALMKNSEYLTTKGLAEAGDPDAIADVEAYRKAYGDFYETKAGELLQSDTRFGSSVDSFIKKYGNGNRTEFFSNTPKAIGKIKNQAAYEQLHQSNGGVKTKGGK